MISCPMPDKRYQPWTPQQPFLLPPSPMQWLQEGHLAFFILDVVGVLDLSPILDAYQAKDARGTRAYDPRMMVALLLYGYGSTSSAASFSRRSSCVGRQVG